MIPMSAKEITSQGSVDWSFFLSGGGVTSIRSSELDARDAEDILLIKP